tara:strand:+ start:383 stop:1333 length:951 start_codon:yes stop_codon:yes gene_type:complete
MAEPSLLCFNCARAPPPHRRTWDRCTLCVERNLPSTYYCGEECMNAHWPKHKVYHKEQKLRLEQLREDTMVEDNRSVAKEPARYAERTGSEYSKRVADAAALSAEGDLHAAAKAWRKIIKEWPKKPMSLAAGRVLDHVEGRCRYLCPLLGAILEEPASDMGFSGEELKALSARVVAVAPDSNGPSVMRASVLSGEVVLYAGWEVGLRTAAEIKEAAAWFGRAESAARSPAEKLRNNLLASACDEVADPLLAEEEAEASMARAAAAAEAAEALKSAEAKAAAAAEELLAEEEKEKQQGSTIAGKAKQSKGKKGKGKR